MVTAILYLLAEYIGAHPTEGLYLLTVFTDMAIAYRIATGGSKNGQV